MSEHISGAGHWRPEVKIIRGKTIQYICYAKVKS